MTAAMALVIYAMAAGTLGARLLANARWVAHAPRSGIVAWQALSTSVVLALPLAALAAALPFLPLLTPSPSSSTTTPPWGSGPVSWDWPSQAPAQACSSSARGDGCE